MRIFRELAGYSLGRADIVRRAMSKKKHDVMEQEREYFIHGLKREDGTVEIEGCIARGVDEQTAAEDACKAEHILSEQTLEKIRESALRNDAAHPQAK